MSNEVKNLEIDIFADDKIITSSGINHEIKKQEHIQALQGWFQPNKKPKKKRGVDLRKNI